MERVPVTSTDIASIGYDSESRVLEVEFIKGGLYQYSEVPPEEHEGFMAADSKGKYFHARIKQYSHVKL